MKEIKQLLAITQSLKNKYVHLNKQFSLDGKLVGDIGEVLAAEKYGLRLYPENAVVHDAEEISSGRKVQIKATFNRSFSFPFGPERIPDYLLAVAIDTEGCLEEVFNGPGSYVVEHYILKDSLRPYGNAYYTLAKGKLKELNKSVPAQDKLRIVNSKLEC